MGHPNISDIFSSADWGMFPDFSQLYTVLQVTPRFLAVARLSVASGGNLQDVPDSLDNLWSGALAGQNFVHIAAIHIKPGHFRHGLFKPLLLFSSLQKLRLYREAERRELARIHKNVPPFIK